MPTWLDPTFTETPFRLFDAVHLTTLALIAASCGLLAWFCQRLAATRSRDTLRYGLAALLLGVHLVWDAWQILVGVWVISWSLPLHLCQLTQLLCAAMLIWRSARLFAVLYFWGLVGAIQALLTPNLGPRGFPHIEFLAFFLSHAGILLAITYMLAAEGLRPTWGGLGRAWLYANLLLPLVALVNWLTGGNYWFIARPPVTPSLIDHLGPWPWYLLGLQAIGIACFVLVMLPFARRRRLAQRVGAA